MLEYSMMRTMRRNFFWTMWTAALLAIFGLVASPALASACCCDDMGKAGHSHSAAIAEYDQDGDHAHHSDDVQIGKHSRSSAVSVSAVCNPTQCEAAPLTLVDNQNKTSIFAPIVALSVQTFSFQAPNTLSVTTFASRVARPRAPDRASCSGLSPPALLQS